MFKIRIQENSQIQIERNLIRAWHIQQTLVFVNNSIYVKRVTGAAIFSREISLVRLKITSLIKLALNEITLPLI